MSPRLTPRALAGVLIGAFVTVAAVAGAAPRAGVDAVAAAPARDGGVEHLGRLRRDHAMTALGRVSQTDERFGVPTFVWAARSDAATARAHLARLAPLYRLTPADAAGAELRRVHDTGRGGIVATFRQTVDGIEVFRDELKLMMDRDRRLLAASGYLPSRDLAGAGEARTFRLDAAGAIAEALRDFGAGEARAVRRAGTAPGGYERYDAGVPDLAPVRAKRVWFHLPGTLVPGWYVELLDATSGVAYVISAADGTVLFRNDLTADATYTYRVWADAAAPHRPQDGPQGIAPSPHPTGTPDFHSPPLVAPSLVSLQNGPLSTDDPWLPPGATETSGNNVDAYVDLFGPDGFSAGDFRATTTSPGTFDRAYDTAQAPDAGVDQRMASVTQLFYVTNWLHDEFYDAGFDEAAGNAQMSNYGRGGVEGDGMRAEAQDYAGLNNATMTTPADGGRPRMHLFVFHPAKIDRVRIHAPAAIAGDQVANVATFGPQVFDVTGEVVRAVDGVSPTGDACSPLQNTVAGKLVLVDLAGCEPLLKVQHAEAAGAIGVIVASGAPGADPPFMTGSGAITIPTLTVTHETGNLIRDALESGPVTASLSRIVEPKDGTLDAQLVAHEWGHYISNRLIGDSNGLSTVQSRGMGEGWGDFHALLLTVRGEDVQAANHPGWSGAYAVGSYALTNSLAPTNAYYFGLRRYPYSTDLGKNPLTFRHIQNGVPLPVGPPRRSGSTGNNANVHNTGEVWCSMLWECWAALLDDSERLDFEQARARMIDYLVAGYAMTPSAPTFTEARDAILAAALAADPADFDLLCAAFAKRGAGTGAVSPDRYSGTNVGAIESFACGGDLAFVSATLDDDVASCDHDGYLDGGETGRLLVTLANTGAATLAATTVAVTSAHPGVSFPDGNQAALPATTPFGSASAAVAVRLNAVSGLDTLELQIVYDDPGLLVPGPRSATAHFPANADEAPSSIETFEANEPLWSTAGSGAPEPWHRVQVGPGSHRFRGPGARAFADQQLVSPPIAVAATGDFEFEFWQTYRFESSGGFTFSDGGVLEISNDDGASWTDIGAFASPSYNGALAQDSGNPLSGREVWGGQSPGYPAMHFVYVNLGTAYAGETVRLRFRVGSDEGVGTVGWDVDDLTLMNPGSAPFLALVADPDPCPSVAVADSLTSDWSFAIAGTNPVRGIVRMGFALPEAARVDLDVFDVGGRRIAKLAGGRYAAGRHEVAWPRDPGAPAGIYFARLVAGGRRFVRRVIALP